MIKILPEETRVLTAYIYSLCGVHLDETKVYLLENRLATLLQEYACSSYAELHFRARNDATNTLPRKIVDAVTTGETSFFRDLSPFDLFQQKLLPELIDRKKKSSLGSSPVSFRIWSAACSSGQEIYSTAIILKETLGNLAQYNIRILGTDVSDQAVTRASRGIYSQLDVDRGLSPERLRKYFSAVEGGWKINDELRALASFKKLNLLEDFSAIGRFDIIFCRNVAIYFTEPDKIRLFNRLGGALLPDGALIIGSTESLTGLCPQFEAMRYMRSVFYRLK